MTTAVVIREATVEDADAIASVHVASWRAAYRGLVPDSVLDGLSVEKRAGAWREWLDVNRRRHKTWIAEVEGTCVGFADAGDCRDGDVPTGTGEINSIYVDETVWDTGIGAQLMNIALSWLREHFTQATLWVLEGNVRGRRFYEKGGWRHDGRSQMLDFDGTELEELRYHVDL